MKSTTILNEYSLSMNDCVSASDEYEERGDAEVLEEKEKEVQCIADSDDSHFTRAQNRD